MPAQDVVTLVRGFFAEAINAHDLQAFPRFCGTDYIWHGSSNPDRSGEVVGLEPFTQAVASFFEAFPDLEATVLDVITEDDRAAVRFFETGTHHGTFMGVAATGRELRWDGIAIYRAQDGLLVEEWSVGDNLALLRQIGGVAPANGATS